MLKVVEDHWHTVEQKVNFIFILSLEKKAIDLLTINWFPTNDDNGTDHRLVIRMVQVLSRTVQEYI